MASDGSILALDVGNRRIGVAAANTIARIAHPLTTIDNDQNVTQKLQTLVADHHAEAVIVGLPRGLSGQETEQTRTTEQFIDSLRLAIPVPVYVQDEAVTSKQAEEELQQKRKTYTKADIDALAATYILEDFLKEMRS